MMTDDLAQALMMDFADSTGLSENTRPRRYLWTDAFAVCNFLGLYRQRDDDRYLELALRLTGQASNPRFELDPEAMQESSRAVLEEAARHAREAGETEVRERGLDVLRGLVGQDDPDPAGVEPDTSPSVESDSTAGAGEGPGPGDDSGA